jgi:acyl-CoA thioester hydrolase
VFERQVPVRWRDTDALGHVNHAVFLTYLEEGRDAFYAQVLDGDLDYVVVRIELDLRAEVRHQDRYVTVQIQAERLGTTSLTTRETILASSPASSPSPSPASSPSSSGEVVAEARVVTVRWNPSQRKPVPFSEAERARLTASIP